MLPLFLLFAQVRGPADVPGDPWSGAGSNRRPSAFQGFYQPETMIRRNTADHSYPHWHWSESSPASYQPCHRVPHNPVSSVGLLWGSTRTSDLWGFCGAAAALRLPADAPSKNLEPMGRDDPAPTVGPRRDWQRPRSSCRRGCLHLPT